MEMNIRIAKPSEFESIRSFYHKVIEIAGNTNQKAVRLDVLEGNLPAERLYLKHGFRYVDTLQMFYEDTGWTDFKLFEYLI